MINGKYLIALCTSRIYDLQTHGFIEFLNESLKLQNCALMIFSINSDIYWEEDLNPAETYVFDILPYDELDCVLIMDEKIKSHTVSNRIIARAKEQKIPVIVIDGKYDQTVCINFDYASGFEKIVRHVIEEHHAENPHMMAGFPGNSFSEERINIFKKVIAENGIPFDDSMVSYGHFWADPTVEAMEALLERHDLPDAIICANDIMAINVCGVLTKAGISVPDQILVSGFDGYDEIFFTSPKISSVNCDTGLLANAACEAILKIVRGEPVSDTYIIPELIPNESCGCPSHTWQTQALLTRFNNSFYRHQDDARILYEITSNMETSLTPWEMAASIHNHKTKTHLCIVDRNCFRTEQNYFMIPVSETTKKDLHLINDADYAEEHRFDRIPLPESVFYDPSVNEKESVLSGGYRARIIELLDSGYPIIFHALDYMNKPIGFNCYYYQSYTITNYSRAASVTSAISLGIGGFVNMQYQRVLLEKMDAMYKHDALTGLYNRSGFQQAFASVLDQPENQGRPITVIMSDLDGLKYINDTFGHEEGDKAIATVASVLKESCPDTALSVRFGGDELFSVIIGDCHPESIIAMINSKLETYNHYSDSKYAIRSSNGAYTTILNEQFDIHEALKAADKNMYIEKNSRRS